MKDELRDLAETLNAYIDRELDAEAVTRLEKRLASDALQARHLRELERVRTLTRAAYPFYPENTRTRISRPPLYRRTAYALAAVLFVGIGIGIDRLLQMPASPVTQDELVAFLPPQAQVIRPAHLEVEVPTGDLRTVFHITSGDPRTIRSTLDHIDRLMRHYAESGKPLRVELVANADGLNALRLDKTPVRDQIANLRSSYPNIKFVACGTTIERIQRAQGKKVKLVPDAIVASSALDQILLRMRQGWTYVRI